MEHHYFVQPVHEFRREFAARRFHGRAFHFLIQAGRRLVRRLNETHSALHQFRNFAAAKVGSQENNRLREVHAPVVTERQRSLVQHAQQQLPERIAGLLNFVKKQEAELQLVRVARR